MDPLNNNEPLQFDRRKGIPPGEMIMDGRNNSNNGPSAPSPQVGPSMMPPGPMMPGPPGFMGMPGMGYSGPMMDPGMMMMGPMSFNQFGGYMGPMGPGMGPPVGPGMGPGMGIVGEFMRREVITLKSCVLYPPPPGAPPPSTRDRPPGCRTIFIGGLPENITEDIVSEVFENFGGIISLRMSKRNFCHIRFETMDSVDRALTISGYRMKLENKDDKVNTGRIHVDFAVARDDQYEFECQQRMYAREMRHRQRIEEEKLCPPSPPPVIGYSDHESQILLEKLKTDETFPFASQILMAWLERGDCNRRNSHTFYALVQCTNSHVRRLLSEKQQHEDEVRNTKEKFRQRFEGILKQFTQIEKVIAASKKQKTWDHFSKAQRKNIDMWLQQCQEIKANQQQEFLNERVEDEMEMSDEDEEDEEPSLKKKKIESTDFVHGLKDENDALKCQVEAYKNEVDLIKHENKIALEEKDKQLKSLQQALQGMQQQLIAVRKQKEDSRRKSSDLNETVEEKHLSTSSSKDGKEEDASRKVVNNSEDSEQLQNVDVMNNAVLVSDASKNEQVVSSTGLSLTEKESKLICLVSCFLHVHPFGASVDYLQSYLNQLGLPVKTNELDELLERLPAVFVLARTGVGASIEKRWKFVAYP